MLDGSMISFFFFFSYLAPWLCDFWSHYGTLLKIQIPGEEDVSGPTWGILFDSLMEVLSTGEGVVSSLRVVTTSRRMGARQAEPTDVQCSVSL